MPRDEVEADDLATAHLDGTHNRAAVRKAPVRGVRRASSVGQAVANGRRNRQAVGAQRVIQGSFLSQAASEFLIMCLASKQSSSISAFVAGLCSH